MPGIAKLFVASKHQRGHLFREKYPWSGDDYLRICNLPKRLKRSVNWGRPG
jgi:hypothetical protein